MPPQYCFGCGCLAEAPLIFVRNARPVVLCEKCFHTDDSSQEQRRIQDDIRAGSICPVCFQTMQRPGGTTIWNRDRTHLIRVCFDCKKLSP